MTNTKRVVNIQRAYSLYTFKEKIPLFFVVVVWLVLFCFVWRHSHSAVQAGFEVSDSPALNFQMLELEEHAVMLTFFII